MEMCCLQFPPLALWPRMPNTDFQSEFEQISIPFRTAKISAQTELAWANHGEKCNSLQQDFSTSCLSLKVSSLFCSWLSLCCVFLIWGKKKMVQITSETKISGFPPPRPKKRPYTAAILVSQPLKNCQQPLKNKLQTPPQKNCWGSLLPPSCPSSGHWHLEPSGLKFLRLPENCSPVLVYPLPFHCSDFSYFCSFRLLSFSLNTFEPSEP